MSDDILTKITASIVEGEPEKTVELTRQALESKLEPLTIINQGLVSGMNIAGEKFSRGEYFLPHLLIAAKGMQGAMALLEPELQAGGDALVGAGTVVLGTVQGDIHEIGKSLVGTMLSANGFQVYDLGVDVSVGQFLDKVLETNADLLGLSEFIELRKHLQGQYHSYRHLNQNHDRNCSDTNTHHLRDQSVVSNVLPRQKYSLSCAVCRFT